MKKLLFIFLSIIIFLFIWNITMLISVGVNFMVHERGTGGITAIGSIIGLWASYKLTKALWTKYFKAPKS